MPSETTTAELVRLAESTWAKPGFTPAQGTYIACGSGDTVQCCLMGAAYLADHPACDHAGATVRDWAVNTLGLDRLFIEGVIDGFDGSEKRRSNKEYFSGWDLGREMRLKHLVKPCLPGTIDDNN